ncbi:syntenin-2 isoform X4 [Orcinus orca]|uniref:syntenin-2 isoform X4 n=1 Tax=Orcinus orca TaxID=9733 RepID=UPI0021136E39|nr:syntenin-2 isoform X4 [Orcinus orca]
MSVPPLSPQPSSPSVPCSVFQRAAMSTLYPSLEDLKVDQAMQAEARAVPRMPALPGQGTDSQPSVLYPNLAELEGYIGLSFSSHEVQQNLPQIPEGASAAVSGPSPDQVVAPVSGNSLGVLPGEVKPGVREIHLCKDERGKTGLRLRAIDKPRPRPSSLSVPARPFQRTVTMHKDSTGHIGFVIKKGKIISLVKGSSAARNGLLINHYVCEVNGQNVIGLKDKEVTEILATAGNVINLAIMPTVIYAHMVRKLSPALLHHTMDHSIPDI